MKPPLPLQKASRNSVITACVRSVFWFFCVVPFLKSFFYGRHFSLEKLTWPQTQYASMQQPGESAQSEASVQGTTPGIFCMIS